MFFLLFGRADIGKRKNGRKHRLAAFVFFELTGGFFATLLFENQRQTAFIYDPVRTGYGNLKNQEQKCLQQKKIAPK